VLDVAFVWRYQRQLTNSYDMRSIMNEFIFNADEDVLAIFLSLPVAFLLWSVLTFSISVLAYAWDRLPNLASPVGVTATLAFVSTLTLVMYALNRWLWIFGPKKRRYAYAAGTYKGPGGARHTLKYSHTINLDEKQRTQEAEKPETTKAGSGSGTVGGLGYGGAEDLKPLDEAATA